MRRILITITFFASIFLGGYIGNLFDDKYGAIAGFCGGLLFFFVLFRYFVESKKREILRDSGYFSLYEKSMNGLKKGTIITLIVITIGIIALTFVAQGIDSIKSTPTPQNYNELKVACQNFKTVFPKSEIANTYSSEYISQINAKNQTVEGYEWIVEITNNGCKATIKVRTKGTIYSGDDFFINPATYEVTALSSGGLSFLRYYQGSHFIR